MAQDDRTLELVYIDIQARTKDLDDQLKRLVDRVEEQGRRAGTNFSEALGTSLNTATDAARDVTAATTGVVNVVQNQLSPALDGAASAARDAALGQKDLDKALADIRERARGVKEQYESGAIGVREFTDQSRALKNETVNLLAAQNDQGASLKRIANEVKATDDITKELGVAVRNVRSAFISGRIGADEFATTSRRLKDEIDELFKSTDLTAQQQLRLNIASATAERGLASLDGRASRLGLAWNVQIGLANQFGQNLRGLGPIGQAAAGGLGLIQGGLSTLNQPLDFTRVRFDGFLASAARAPQVLALAGAALSTLALVGMARLATEAARVADEIDKASSSVGLAAEEFQELEFALSQSGVRSESVRTALGNLNTRIGEAINGNDKYRATLQRLGVDLDAIKAGSQGVGDALGQVADGIARLSTPAEQAQAATELFGRGIGNQLLPALKQGSEGIADLRQQARDLGLVISGDAIISLVEYADTVEALKQQFQTARVEIAAAFLPVLRDLLIPLIQNSLVPLMQRAAQSVSEFSAALLDAGPAGAEFRREIVETLEPVVLLGQAIVAAGAAGLGGFLTLLGGAAQFGAYLGTLSVQVENYISKLRDLAPLFTAIGRLSADPIGGGIALANAIRDIRPGTFDSPFDLNAASEAGQEAGQRYYEQALAAFETAGAAATFDLADFLENTAATVRTAIERGVGSFSEVGETAGRELATGIAAGVTAEDPAAAAKAWSGRLLAEVQFGLRDAGSAFDLLNPRLQELRDEAATALSDFGFDSAEFAEIVAKINALESALRTLGVAARDIAVPEIDVRVRQTVLPPEVPDFVQFSLDFGAQERLEAARAADAAAASEAALEVARRKAANDNLRLAEEGQQLLTGATRQAQVAAANEAAAEAQAAAALVVEAEAAIAAARRQAASDNLRLAEEGLQLQTGVARQASLEAAEAEAALAAARQQAANDNLRLAEEGLQLQTGEVLARQREEAAAAAEEVARAEAQLATLRQRAAVITGNALTPTQALVLELQNMIAPTDELRAEIEALTRSLLDAEAAAAAAAAADAAADAAKRARAEYEQLATTIINTAGQAANGFVEAFRDLASGNIGGGLGGILGSAGGLVGLLNPIAGALFGVFGSLIGNLFGGQARSQQDLERTRAGSNASRSAPAVQVSFTISEPRFMFDTDFDSPQTRQVMRGIFDDWMEEFVRRTGLANLLRDRLAIP